MKDRTIVPAFAAVLAILWASTAMAGAVFMPGGLRSSKIRSFQEIKQSRVVHQRWDMSCGSAALSTLLTYHFNDPTPESVIIVSILRRNDPVKIRNRGGFSLLNLKKFVEGRGYKADGYIDLSLKDLLDMKTPAVIPVSIKGYDHFVVFRGEVGDRILLSDPVYGNVTIRKEHFLEIWKNGIGFIVKRRGSGKPRVGLVPRSEEFMVPDGAAIGRAITGIRPPAPIRNVSK